MENVQETTEQKETNETCEEIIKPDDQQILQQQHVEEEQPLQQQEQKQEEQHKQQDLTEPQVAEEDSQQKLEVKEKLLDAIAEAPAVVENHPSEPQTIAYEEHNDEEEEDEDDDEEKETSQKLVIDIPDEEEEEEEEEKDDLEDEDNDVIALDDLPQEVLKQKVNEKPSPKSEMTDAIITLSDGEEDIPASEEAIKPGKVQKRRSMGAASVTAGQDEERFRLKRRKINVAGAPKMPLTGYVRYMNDRRDSLRKEHPSKTAMEHTKMIGEEWHALSSDVKANYLKAADVDKQRYVKELHSFLKSRPDILASELAKNKIRKTGENNSPNPTANAAAATSTNQKPVLKDKPQINEATKSKDNMSKDKMTKDNMPSTSTAPLVTEKLSVNDKNKRKRTPTPPTSTTANNNNTNTTNANMTNTTAASCSSSSNITSTIVTPTPGEIPIFTNEFLEHNKIYDMELRSLRKSKTDLEQQNSVLEKHVENMKFGVEKMVTENNELEEKNRLLEIYLDKLKRKLALALGGLPLPTAPNGATVENIDKYMQDLYKMSTSNSHGPATLNKAKDIIRKLDLQIQL
ncbi:high mobility group protein 20A [Lucilia cuprina]|uniref:high mobility group protein 20A n=1 Tax=Lucilia cuprina TaxID=7375 RepID=UPI001F056FF9|nr:high mobility group protein 20A [Lucilia cuprina]